MGGQWTDQGSPISRTSRNSVLVSFGYRAEVRNEGWGSFTGQRPGEGNGWVLVSCESYDAPSPADPHGKCIPQAPYVWSMCRILRCEEKPDSLQEDTEKVQLLKYLPFGGFLLGRGAGLGLLSALQQGGREACPFYQWHLQGLGEQCWAQRCWPGLSQWNPFPGKPQGPYLRDERPRNPAEAAIILEVLPARQELVQGILLWTVANANACRASKWQIHILSVKRSRSTVQKTQLPRQTSPSPKSGSPTISSYFVQCS